MSIRVESRIGIQASADRVWEIVADLKAWGAWNPTYPEASGVIGFGETLTFLERLPGRPDQRISGRVLDWTPGAQLAMRVEQGFMTHRLQYIEIDKLAEVGCILAVGCYFRGWFDEGAAKRLGPAAKAGFAAMVDALKLRAEGSGAGG
jgi:hypothetical protein